MYFRSPKVPKGGLWMVIKCLKNFNQRKKSFTSVRLFVLNLILQPCGNGYKLKRSHYQACPFQREGGPPLAVEGITYLSTLRSRISSELARISSTNGGFIPQSGFHFPSRARGAYRAHTVCISRGIPPSVDMLHITCGSAAHITTSKARHITHRRCLPRALWFITRPKVHTHYSLFTHYTPSGARGHLCDKCPRISFTTSLPAFFTFYLLPIRLCGAESSLPEK